MKRNIILILTLLLAGRAMTLAFIPQAGSAVPGAPPAAWLMPLIGDAIVGITAVFIAVTGHKGCALRISHSHNQSLA